MNPLEKLHYALGEIAYAMVWSDSSIRPKEIGRFMDAVTSRLNLDVRDFDVLGTLFNAITGEKKSAALAYEEAMEKIRMNADYFHPELKKSFVRTLEHIEQEYAPFTMIDQNSRSLVDRFKQDVASISGQRVFMGAIYLN